VFFFKPPAVATKYHSIGTLRHETCVLLSGLAYVASEIASERDKAFAAGFRELFVDRELYDDLSQVYKRMEGCNSLADQLGTRQNCTRRVPGEADNP
jgi:hypothetical protein